MGRKFKVLDQETGQTHDVDWIYDRDPSQEDLAGALNRSKNEQYIGSIPVRETGHAIMENLKWLTGPIEPLVEAGRKLSDKITDPSNYLGPATIQEGGDDPDPVAQERYQREAEKQRASTLGAVGGGVEGAASVPSPIDAVTLPVSLAGRGMATIPRLARMGAGVAEAGRGLNAVGDAANLAVGLDDVVEGAGEGDLSRVGGGLLRGSVAGLSRAAAMRGHALHPDVVDFGNWEKFNGSPGVRKWAEAQVKDYGYKPDEVQLALEESFKHRIDPTKSDDLVTLGEHMDATLGPKVSIGHDSTTPPTEPERLRVRMEGRVPKPPHDPDVLIADARTQSMHPAEGLPGLLVRPRPTIGKYDYKISKGFVDTNSPEKAVQTVELIKKVVKEPQFQAFIERYHSIVKDLARAVIEDPPPGADINRAAGTEVTGGVLENGIAWNTNVPPGQPRGLLGRTEYKVNLRSGTPLGDQSAIRTNPLDMLDDVFVAAEKMGRIRDGHVDPKIIIQMFKMRTVANAFHESAHAFDTQATHNPVTIPEDRRVWRLDNPLHEETARNTGNAILFDTRKHFDSNNEARFQMLNDFLTKVTGKQLFQRLKDGDNAPEWRSFVQLFEHYNREAARSVAGTGRPDRPIIGVPPVRVPGGGAVDPGGPGLGTAKPPSGAGPAAFGLPRESGGRRVLQPGEGFGPEPEGGGPGRPPSQPAAGAVDPRATDPLFIKSARILAKALNIPEAEAMKMLIDRDTIKPLRGKVSGLPGTGPTPPVPPVPPPGAAGPTPPTTPPVPKVKKAKAPPLPGHGYTPWVNTRRATQAYGELTRRNFEKLLDGQDTIAAGVDYQKRGVAGRPEWAEVQRFTQDLFQRAKKVGLGMGWKENYLTQMWKDDPATVRKVLRRLGLKPSFTLESTFANYEEGIKNGLTPRYTKVSDILGAYEEMVRKSISDRMFFNELKQKKQIKMKSRAPQDGTWIPIDQEHFPQVAYLDKHGRRHTEPYFAPGPIADQINNYLRNPEKFGKVLAATAKPSSYLKNLRLAGGIPGTAFNIHGLAISARRYLTGMNPIEGVKKGMTTFGDLFRPDHAFKKLEGNLKDLPELMDHGFTATVEDHVWNPQPGSGSLKAKLGFIRDYVGETPKRTGAWGKVVETLHKGMRGAHAANLKFFDEPLFQKVLPNAKLEFAVELRDYYLKQGLKRKEALRTAATQANHWFGGINWIEKDVLKQKSAAGREWASWSHSRDFRNLLQTVILAPDWLESHLQLAKGTGKALLNPKDPKGRIYQAMAVNAAVAYIVQTTLNKTLTGRWSHEQKPNQQFSSKIGEIRDPGDKKVKEVMARPFTTGMDHIQIPLAMALGVARGDLDEVTRPLKNRRALPLHFLMNLFANQNDFGRPILGPSVAKGKSLSVRLGKQLENVGVELNDVVTPPYLGAPIKYALGKSHPVEAVGQGIELPITLSSKKTGKKRHQGPPAPSGRPGPPSPGR